MENRWSTQEARNLAAQFEGACSPEVALLVYASRLLGAERGLVLHGGGNASVKGERNNLFGQPQQTLTIKGSGRDLASAVPGDFANLSLSPLQSLRSLPQLTEKEMAGELRRNLLDCGAPYPSIETLAHAFLPAKYVLHTHADAVLVLTNRTDGADVVRAALGSEIILLAYHRPGYALAKAAAAAFESNSQSRGMIWLQHGIVTWGESAEEAYSHMIELVSKSEQYAEQHANPRSAAAAPAVMPTGMEDAARRMQQLAPIVRGILVRACSQEDQPPGGAIVLPLITPEVLDILGSKQAKEVLVSPPLTSDHLIRTKPVPLWIETAEIENTKTEAECTAALADLLRKAIDDYGKNYQAYVERNANGHTPSYDGFPRLILIPGAGVLAAGCDMDSAIIARDIALQSLFAKSRIASMGGTYVAPSETDLFHMEYDPFQRAKLAAKPKQSMAGRTALVTGAAGAIGQGVCEELLRRGCAVALGDLPGERLTAAVENLANVYGNRVLAAAFDVTDPKQVSGGFREITRAWGGLDLVVINAGVAHASSLAEIDLESFRRLEQVNVEGTLNLLSESARHFRLQNSGGDVVLISTKNVFAPGAGFGAYSATKAAAHQLARIASLEMAEIGVRVNMVAPDAVFNHGSRRSGLWETVGPDRMRARGLDEKGLESYYQSRNLLKARITATHVANAVIFFATRQTPTTGATIPVDGGLPDATPR
jgi:rhamnose utilization protein RhaD (predicted bifunctional aldolase and dehydrogenase)/NAD(P)-dependent dehydrogenase (short-subunit alcohol dehydrogenase family)